jgi:hypothetical protein
MGVEQQFARCALFLGWLLPNRHNRPHQPWKASHMSEVGISYICAPERINGLPDFRLAGHSLR